MSVNWTSEQLDAIEAKGRAIVVSAAAGSGKTAVLVEKLLRILSDRENPVPADRIVVVTFTNDAAAQMKQRLAAALAEASEREPENEWLAAQQALIPSAKISTIHSFCFSLIRENAGSLDVDSAFRVLDSAEDDVIAAKAADNIFEERFENAPDTMKRLTDFFCPGAKDSRRLAALIPELRKNILALPFPLDYMERVENRYKSPPPPEKDPLLAVYTDHVVSRLKKAAALADEYYDDALSAYGSDGELISKIQKNMSMLSEECEKIRSAVSDIIDDPRKLFKGGSSISFEKITFYSSGNYKNSSGDKIECEFDKELLDGAKSKRNTCKKLISSCFGEFTPEDIAGDYMIHGEICNLFFLLMKDILTEERRLKNEKNALGFSDAEQLACGLLCCRNADGTIEKTALAKELSDYFSIVMIDEFQDSTAVQELIFRMISKDGSADRAGTNFFAVGDVKQSIYRFRCADPRIFLRNTENSVRYENDGSTAPAYILLNRNFRSSHGVVEFVNAVFNAIMCESCGGIDYGEDDSLIEGAGITDDFSPTEIICLPDAEGNDDESDDDSSSFSPLDIAEARCVAVKIKELLGKTITDKGETRPVRPSDICILTRTSKKTPLFISCLESLGIFAAGAAEESYLGSREISVLINLLRCIDNPTLDIPLASVLMSPMFMFTAEDMGNLRLNRSSCLFADITAACSGNSTLSELCRSFCQVFGTLREYSASHSIEELIRYIYDKTDFLSVISVYKDSAAKKANLRLLPVYAASYDKNGTGGLSGFVRQINNMLESSKDFAAASAAGETREAVEIKTIHRSKGLEYPFVFLCSTWTKFNMTDVHKQMVFTSDFGTAFRISDPSRLTAYESFPRRAMSIIKEKSQRDEEMMLLYVALTRAKHKLFITRRTDEKAEKHRETITLLTDRRLKKQEDAVNEGMSMADWLDAAVSLFTPHDGTYSLGDCEIVFSEGMTTAESIEDNAMPNDTAENGKPAAKYDPVRAEEFRRMTASEYDMTLSKTASKVTVSEISKNSDFPVKYIFSDGSGSLSRRPKGVSAAAAGTAVHAFMQHADIKALGSCSKKTLGSMISDEAHRLAQKGIISEAQSKCCKKDIIGRFLDSELCRRMTASEEIYREKKFLVKISDINLDDDALMVYNDTEGMLQGVADCIFREGDGFVLVDYKTDRHVTAEILTERYSTQLSLYAKALSLILGKPVTEGYLYSFYLGEAISVSL